MTRKTAYFLLFFLLFVLLLPACSSGQAQLRLNTPLPSNALPEAGVTLTVPVTAIPTPALVSATPVGSAVCNSKTGSLEMGVINTALLAKPMRYTVYLPPCYNFDKKVRYPVLYLLHGQGYTEDQWMRIGAGSTADKLISTGEIPPFLMVFPFDFSIKQPAEYKFEEVFIQLLVPRIDATYRTNPVATQRAIGGLSRGGAWALHIGALHPELFGAIGGHSPAIFFTDEKKLARAILAIKPDQMPRIWLDAGDSDSEYDVIVPFEKFLIKNNIPHEWHKYVGWHDEKYWSAHVEKYLRWYALGWR